MFATMIYGPRDVRLEEVADPRILVPTDAVVRVSAACVCGSDLWRYRGITAIDGPSRIGHEFIGVVEEVGSEVRDVRAGDFVIAPFSVCDNTCFNCRNGFQTACLKLSWWGENDHADLFADGGQGERIRVPLADGTLVVAPEAPAQHQLGTYLALSDVMSTGHHAAVSGNVRRGSTVAVIGDGAVGLCAVLAAKRLGAERIIAMSRHASRQAVARQFGATDIIEERGDAGRDALVELMGGVGVDAALECVGTKESMQQALDVARPGGKVGFVGVPAGGPELPVGQMFSTNVGVAGGVAPAREYIPELLRDVLAGTLDPGPVFDLVVPFSEVAEAYSAMDERRAIKSMLVPS